MPETSSSGHRRVANRVLMTLLVTALLAAVLLPFASMAPNRLVSGQSISAMVALPAWQGGMLLMFALVLAVCALHRPFPDTLARGLTLGVAPLWLILVLYGLGDYAERTLQDASPAARVSQGAAFWILLFCPLLMIVDAFQRLGSGLALRSGYAALIGIIIAFMFASGLFDALSIMREYANNRGAFSAEFLTHLRLVGTALGPALLIGLPLGLMAHRLARIRGPLFGILNFFQTIPSIALFALLVAPLSALGEAFPWVRAMGVQGIGAAPAVIALIMYALLPVVRNTYAGFADVSPQTIEAARGMGMSTPQILWRIEIPLALPVILSGLRIVTVQAIGLTVVAALIGAGGLGAFIFQGLGQYAIDLVLLGAVPTIALAVTADFLLQIIAALSKPAGT